MAKKFTKVLCALLAFVMCLGTVPAFAIEATPELTAEEKAVKWPIDKTANGLDDKDQTDVSLTVPGIVEGYIDVVFIVGGNMTENQSLIESAISIFEPAMRSGKAVVRLGLISLQKSQEIILDLNSDEAILNPDTYWDFAYEKFNSITHIPGGTTNLHSQLLEAQKMLEAETKAEPENKYLFVLSTGRTYWFDDENGNQSFILSESENGKDFAWGNFVWQQQRAVGTSYYQIPTKYNNSYEAYFKDIENWVSNDGDKYVYAPGFDPTDIYAYSNWYAANILNTCPISATNSKRMGHLIENPAPDPEKYDGITFKYNSKGGPAHALNYERAQYECVQVWKELVAKQYNCYSICTEQYRYQNHSSYIGGNGIQLGHAFMDYLSELAGKGKAVVAYENDGTQYGKLRNDFFEEVLDDSLYTTSIGTTVEDYIGINENGNFEFIQDANAITLVVGGKTYKTEEITPRISDTWEAANFSVAFYAPDDSQDGWADDPTFWLDYYYRSGKEDEQFVWEFGENVSMENLATLTYKLQLTGKQEEAGEYIVPTNISATLYPVYSNGKDGKPQDFPIPEVDYEVNSYDVDIVLALGAGIAKYDNDYKSNDGTEYHNTYDSIVTLVEPLVNQGINVKLGLVAVEHYTEKAMDLTVLTKENYKEVIQGGLETIQNMPAGPTNLEGVIAEAHAMLNADTEVPNSNKFFYVIATGRTYCFDDADGNPATTLNSVSLKGKTYYYWGHYAWQSQRGRHTSLYMIPDKYDDNFSAYWKDVVAMNEADIEAGDEKGNGKYDYTMPGDYSESDWYVGTEGFFTNNSTDAKAMGLGSSRYGWIIKGLTNTDEKIDAIGSGVNPGHAMAYDRGQYEAWVAYEAMKKDGINCYALCSESPSYQNGSPYIQVAKYTGTSTIQVGHSFMDFLAGGEATLLFQMTDDNGNYKIAENFFTAVDQSELVKSGEALGSSALSLRNSAAKNAVASVSVDAEGDALTYEWYYKNQGSDEFTLSSFTGADFRAVMSSDYDGMQVYCVITDQYGNSTTTEVVTLNLD